MFHGTGRELQCCYRASIDGFSAVDFHRCCDFKGPCVVVGYTTTSFKFGAFNPEGYRSTDDYYDTFDAFLFYWKEAGGSSAVDDPVVLPKVGGSGAAIFDYARGGPQFGADGLLVGPPLTPVMGVFTGPDSSSGVGDLRQAKSRLGLSYAKRDDGKESVFGDVPKATLVEVQVFCSPQIASLCLEGFPKHVSLCRSPIQHLATSFPTQIQIPFPPTLSQPMYSELLLSATKSLSLIRGKEVHAHIIKACFTPCMFLQNVLLNMYCKCGDMSLAQRLFDTMPTRDTVSWNSLITGYSQVGVCRKSLDVFNEARSVHIKLDHFTYASALSVCSRNRDLKMGKVIHGMVLVSGFYQRVFLTNSLIDMYSKCGGISDASLVFDSSSELDDVSWNSMISAYVRIGWDEETLRTFAKMARLGIKLNPFALGSVLKSCSSLSNSVILGKMVHGCIIKVGLDSNVFAGSAMIDLYAKNGCLSEAAMVFNSVPDPNVVVFNSMIAGFSRLETDGNNEHNYDAVCLFSEMQRRGMRSSKFTFSSVLRACNFPDGFELGKQIHGQIFKNNLKHDEYIGSALIEMYSSSGSIEEGFKCFHSVPKQDIVTWTSMISGCVQVDHFERALSLFHDLLSIGIKPDHFTLSCLMSACANLAVARSGEQIQCYAIKVGFNWFTIINNSQIFMYARSGDVDAANQTFQEMENRDVVSWSAMISSHAQHGCASDALMLFKEMEGCKVSPNQVTLLGVLTACSHGGLVDEGLR
ncbi:hypothetical protein GW17_00003826 [Ensete ventricosum]|nr:hypothetical protein GW17_00003826 [Ensete ventricosum]